MTVQNMTRTYPGSPLGPPQTFTTIGSLLSLVACCSSHLSPGPRSNISRVTYVDIYAHIVATYPLVPALAFCRLLWFWGRGTPATSQYEPEEGNIVSTGNIIIRILVLILTIVVQRVAAHIGVLNINVVLFIRGRWRHSR